MTIEEYDKIKLKTGEIARVVEIAEQGVMYVAEIFKLGAGVEIDYVKHESISSVFKETEYPVA